MKKILSLILSCSMCLTVAVAAGCEKTPTQNNSTALVEKLELSNENMLLTLGDEVELSASYNLIDGETLSWSSSAPNVVSVDENGCIEALRVGGATITVSYGSKKDTCKVEVGLSGNVPTLVFDNNMNENITLLKGSTFDFSAHVEFNGKTFSDGEIGYQVMDESIGTIENGQFTAKNLEGSTTVSVYATWRGQTVYAKTIDVKVVSETMVLLNDGMLTAINIYTAEEHEGETYQTMQTISSVYVSEDEKEVTDYTLSILDEGIATIEQSGDSWNIKANKAGSTNLLVAYSDKEFYFPIDVKRPVSVLETSIDYSLFDRQYFDEENKILKPLNTLVEGFDNLVSYEYLGKEYKLKDNVLNLSIGKNNEVIFYNEKVGYRLTVCAYTMIIDELKDFEMIYAGESETDITGAYMLAKDIIEPETVLSMPEGKVPNNFSGTFDGKGHVLSFTFLHGEHKFGLFGQFLKGATIKNLALNNITKSGTAGKNPSGIICYEGSDGNSKESLLENIFVDLKFIQPGASNLAFMGNAMWATIMRNVIIHVPEVPVNDTYGSFARGEAASVSGAYVISTAPLYVTVQPTNFKVKPTLYANYQEMLNAGNDYSSFSAEFWDTTTYGIPVWKSLVHDFVL